MHNFSVGDTVRNISDKWYPEGTVLKITNIDVAIRFMNIRTETLNGNDSLWVDRTEIEPCDLSTDILESVSGTMQQHRLQLLIDEALDSGDRDKFIEYSNMIKEMFVHA